MDRREGLAMDNKSIMSTILFHLLQMSVNKRANRKAQLSLLKSIPSPLVSGVHGLA